MKEMFYHSKFNGDISNWDVSNVINTEHMFQESEFNQNISKWNLKKIQKSNCMFLLSKIEEKYKPQI
jgi:surface protein